MDRLKDVLRTFMEYRDLTVPALSERCYISEDTLYKWFRGETKKPQQWIKVLQVAAALDLTREEAAKLLRAAKHSSFVGLPIEKKLREATAEEQALIKDWLKNVEQLRTVHSPAAQALHQLRAPIKEFVGRADEVNRLVTALWPGEEGNAEWGVVGSIHGMAGIGKTALAYKVAHRLIAMYPDAQIVLELQGASRTPVSRTEALRTVLRAFDREATLPDELGDLERVYRSRLFGKRVLILADDALDSRQVQSLVPPPGSAVLITSREHFRLEESRAPVPLMPLSKEEAEELLFVICPRIGESAQELAELCGRLPLALRVSASLLDLTPAWDVGGFLQQLSDVRTRLLHLRDPFDSTLDVEVSLVLSYEKLDPVAQSVLCQLSVFSASFDREAAKAIIALQPAEPAVDSLLNQLSRRSLLEWDTESQRYKLHDLVRALGMSRLKEEDATRQRHARYYLQLVKDSHELYERSGEASLASLALFDVERMHIDAALAWIKQLLESSTGKGLQDLLVGYAPAIRHIGMRYRLKGRTSQALEYCQLAFDTARILGDKQLASTALIQVGNCYKDMGDIQQALEHYQTALDMAQEICDRRTESAAKGNIGLVYSILNDYEQAIACHNDQLAIARAVGDLRIEGNALNDLATVYVYLGKYEIAIELFQRRLDIVQQLSDPIGESLTLSNLGAALTFSGNPQEALIYYRRQLPIVRELNYQLAEGNCLGNMGMAYAALEDYQAAIRYYEQHLKIACEIGDRIGEGNALGNLSVAYARLGKVERALEFYKQRVVIADQIPDERGKAEDSWSLGLALKQQGRLIEAVALMQISVDYYDKINHKDAERHFLQLKEVQQRVAELQGASS